MTAAPCARRAGCLPRARSVCPGRPGRRGQRWSCRSQRRAAPLPAAGRGPAGREWRYRSPAGRGSAGRGRAAHGSGLAWVTLAALAGAGKDSNASGRPSAGRQQQRAHRRGEASPWLDHQPHAGRADEIAARDRTRLDAVPDRAGWRSRPLRGHDGCATAADSSAARFPPGAGTANPASDSCQSKPEPPDAADPLNRVEVGLQRHHSRRRHAVGLAPVLGRQGLDQAHPLEPVEGAVERPWPQLQPGELLDVTDQRVPVLGAVGQAREDRTEASPARRSTSWPPVSSRSRAVIAPPSTLADIAVNVLAPRGQCRQRAR